MADDTAAPAPTPAPDPQSIEEKLGAFNFDEPSPPPAGNGKEPSDDAAYAEVAAEQSPAEPAPVEEDDPETTLRDGTRIRHSELKRGYLNPQQREAFNQRVQQLEQRQRNFARQTRGFDAVQQQTASLLNQMVEYAQTRLPKPPDQKLLDTDPFEFQRQKAHYDNEQSKLGELNARRQAYYNQVRWQQRQAQERHLWQQREALLAAMPELRDRVRATQFTEGVKALGAKLGYTPAELNQVYDSRLVKLIAMAMRADAQDAALAKAKAKLKEAQKPEVQAPTRVRRTPGQVDADQRRAALERLRRNPNSAKAAEDILSKFD